MRRGLSKVVIAIALFGLSAPALAQGKATAAATTAKIDSVETSVNREQTIGRLLEEHVRQVLRRYVTDSEFNATVRVETATKALGKIPYLPPAQSAAALNALPPERLVAATNKVSVQVALAKRYKAKTRIKLAQILSMSLGLRKNGSDAITFEDLDLELPTQRSDIEINLMRIEADLRQERTKAEQIRKERDDLKLEVVAVKTGAEKQSRLAQLGQAKTVPATTTNTTSDVMTRLKDFGVPGIFALIGLFFAIVLARSFGGIGRGIGDAATAVSRAIEASAGGAAVSSPTVDVRPDAVRNRDAGAVASLPPPLESLQRTVKELHEDLSQRLNIETQPFVVQYLSQQFAGFESIDKGVAAMELFGRDHANSLFEKLNPAAQVVVLDFIRQGHYSRPKLELMVEAGEELNTRLLGQAVMQTVSQIDQDIAAKIMGLQIEDLGMLALTLTERLAARLFGSLAPGHIAAVLTEVHRTADNELARITDLILKIPETGPDKALDNELLAALTATVAVKSVDIHKPYLKFYGEIMAAADDQVSEAMFGKFMTNPQVAGYIRRNTVTFSMFFLVTKEIQEDVLAQLTIKDLAALYSGLVLSAEKNLIEGLLPERRRDAVREETIQWARRGGRQLQVAHKQARLAVTRRLSTLQKNGGLDFQADDGFKAVPSQGLAAA